MNIQKLLKSLFLLLFVNISFAQTKQIAITIDDLPFVGEYKNFHLEMILNTLKEKKVPATGFIIAKEVQQDNWDMLNKFRDAGFSLGNHTYSHANLNNLSTIQSIEEIRKADKLLDSVLTKPRYFRYPYLATGHGDKKEQILCYLAQTNYHIAPVTIDSKDFAFNQRLLSVPEAGRRAYFPELKGFYLEFIREQTRQAEEKTPASQAQILLIHANLLNAYALSDLIELFRQEGYSFISLEEALKTIPSAHYCSKLARKH